MIYHTKNPEKDIATKLDKNHFFIVIRVYIYHFQGLGPILNSKNVFCFLNTEGWRERSLSVREGSRYQIRWIFGKVPKGGCGGHFQSKSLCCRFWELWTELFEHEIDTKVNSGFRVCFFNSCIEKYQNKTHFEKGMFGFFFQKFIRFSSRTPS